jgi:hypothetical protein
VEGEVRYAGALATLPLLIATHSFAQETWHRTGPQVCGKILVKREGRTRAAKKVAVKVYRSKDADVATCCDQAEFVLETKTDGSGNFFVNKLDAGDYFLMLSDGAPALSIPIQLGKSYMSKACNLDQRFTVDAATGKSEISVIVTVD